MAERWNLAIITQEKTIFYEDRWGGSGVWELLLKGCDFTFDIYTNLQFEPDILQIGCDSAILIDEVNKNVIIDIYNCGFLGLTSSSNTISENEHYEDFLDRVNFFNSRENVVHPNFIDTLIKIARFSWLGWKVYFADYRDFLEQQKFESQIEQIPSVNYHLKYDFQFPELSEDEIIKHLKINFDGDYDSSRLVLHHLEQYERSKLS